MLNRGETFVRAQDVINALATPYFLPEFTWGIDSYALDHTRASITQFFNEGDYSLVYVLQVKLLQVEIKTRYLPSIDPLDGLRRSPLWYAARGSHFEVMSILVKRVSIRVTSEQRTVIRAEPELLDSYGQTAASTAARDGRVNDLRYLLGLRGKSWSPLLEPLMINEHLLLAYAVQSRNRECVKLVLAQRQWRFGGPVFTRAMDYANRNFDEDLRSR
ncbi:hypothetical protein N0V91_005411 [Didymella pomorum]|uniref:Uncharacterized protein n=1 Tax=Didymella pomorum TaxID=749634 RepID=A0A9W8ZD17_9PLEO|nr:hypothetical protein N0V91_005411 [Didymella pomorum]